MSGDAFHAEKALYDPNELSKIKLDTKDLGAPKKDKFLPALVIPFQHPAINQSISIPSLSNVKPSLLKNRIITKKSKWTKEEDEMLKAMVQKEGTNWSLIARSIIGRTGKQCRERWVNQLQPELKQNEWSPHEDAILIQQQKIFGNVWTKIAKFLPGRSPNNVKNRWSWLSRHQNAANFYALQAIQQQLNYNAQAPSGLPIPVTYPMNQPIVLPSSVKIIVMNPNPNTNPS